MRATRRGFSLLEVMVALSILVVCLVLLVETQSGAILMTREAERVITATDLAQQVMTDAMLELELEGFPVSNKLESGDFDDLGDDLLNVEIGDELKDFHWEYTIVEVDLQMLGGAAEAAQGMDGLPGAGGNEATAGLGGGDAGGGLGSMLGAAGMGPEQITEMMTPYVREVRVRIWWGDDSEEAEEVGNEVVVVGHAVNPAGATSIDQMLSGAGAGAAGAIPGLP